VSRQQQALILPELQVLQPGLFLVHGPPRGQSPRAGARFQPGEA
jgi:hypothetical protein